MSTQTDPVLAVYFGRHPEALDQALDAIKKVDGNSVNEKRDCKLILWRLAGKMADSGLLPLTHDQLYERLKRSTGL